jgi:hypothetical protein
MLRSPIAHDETLETEFVLEDVVLEVGVLASVTVVDLVVRAHDRACASTHGIGERPYVKLVLGNVSMCSWTVCTRSTNQSNVVKVRRDGLADVGSTLAEVFLFVGKVMFCASDDTSFLDALDRLVHSNTREHWIR